MLTNKNLITAVLIEDMLHLIIQIVYFTTLCHGADYDSQEKH